jgi:hypothetical protein
VFVTGIKGSKSVARMWKMMKTVLITFFDIRHIHSFIHSFHKASQPAKHIIWKYWSSYVKLCIEKVLNFGLMIRFTTVTMPWLTSHSLSSSFWPKNRLQKWNTYPLPLIGSEWLLLISTNKVCLKGTKISGYWRHPKNVMALKTFTTGVSKMFLTVAASLG